MKRTRMRVFRIIIGVILIIVMGFSSFQIYQIWNETRKEKAIHSKVMEFKPSEPPVEPETVIVNQSILDLQAKYPDVVGWLTIDGTNIDYPFAQAADNNTYLRTNLDGKYATAGSVFMDYRCKKDFSGVNNIIYGHHMKDGSMFSTVQRFNDKTFFEANSSGTIYLPNDILPLKVIAFTVIKPEDKHIYSLPKKTDAEQLEYFDYIRKTARYFRETELKPNDRIVTLSTCNYEFNNARMSLICLIEK